VREVTRHPLSWYVAKLERGEPFTSLLYGDGELCVAAGLYQGQLYTGYHERVTPRLALALRDALALNAPDVVYGTDPHLINYETYAGQDAIDFRQLGASVRPIIEAHPVPWVDGVVWEDAVRAGEAAPLLSFLARSDALLIGHPSLRRAGFFDPDKFVEIPARNAFGSHEATLAKALASGRHDVYVVCAGLGAVPLCMALRERWPDATFLDLGSTFDVFAGLGATRGWRAELYADPARLADLRRRNLAGVPLRRKR
jgi:hypothetical protein